MSVVMKTALASMVLLAISASGVQAAGGSGQITFQGEIMDSACAIKPGSSDQTITLAQVAKSQLSTGGVSPTETFQIELVGCDQGTLTNKTVTATFTGPGSADVTGALGIVGTAGGAGIMMVDGSGKAITLGAATTAQQFQNNNNTLSFGAYLKGKATGTITPGDFSAVTNFSLAYQ